MGKKQAVRRGTIIVSYVASEQYVEPLLTEVEIDDFMANLDYTDVDRVVIQFRK